MTTSRVRQPIQQTQAEGLPKHARSPPAGCPYWTTAKTCNSGSRPPGKRARAFRRFLGTPQLKNTNTSTHPTPHDNSTPPHSHTALLASE
eukprot:10360708-Alexandrium_andersonii.AAC.1